MLMITMMRTSSMQRHYKMDSSTGYSLRRDARLRKRAAEEAAANNKSQKSGEKDDPDEHCVIS